MSAYRTKIADQCRLITITWCKNLLLHGLSVSVEGPEGESQYTCKVELKPWYFWRKQGSKRFVVEHLQWKFRGNEYINLRKLRVEVYWDVHDWLFSPGLRHALFIFKPIMSSTSLSLLSTSSSSPTLSSSISTPVSSQTGGSGSLEGLNAGGRSSDFCLFLYAWKVE
ncbi:50S ribosomal protein L19 [Populus alba x Populus x berolinensis]|nr:50S ribosomal protein L19 [Populus alba x Populus x berolinensis]